jgi:DNA adenine methylase
MKYLGGKAQIAKRLVSVINREVGAATPCWEPFMGGGNMTTWLARSRTGVASDAHPALMAMWIAAKQGWAPPIKLTKEQWEMAKTLPDTDPLKAFAGCGCSYRGMWFGGYTGVDFAISTKWKPGRKASYRLQLHEPALYTRNAIKRTVSAAARWEFKCESFFDVEPAVSYRFIYADPPYEGTEGYPVGDFDHDLFWKRCKEWARFVPVIVSEYKCPVEHRLLFETTRSSGLMNRSASAVRAPTERLFRVLP